MTESTSPALDVALAYHQAWTSHDLDKAMTYIADEIVCDAPAGRLEGAAAYREFMGPFVQILTGSKLIAAFGDHETALVMYDTQTMPVKTPLALNVSRSRTGRSPTACSSSTAPHSMPPATRAIAAERAHCASPWRCARSLCEACSVGALPATPLAQPIGGDGSAVHDPPALGSRIARAVWLAPR